MKRIGLISVSFLLTLLACASFHEAYAQSARGLAIPRERLPKGLAETAPKDFFLPSDQKKAGVVHALEGTLVIIHGKTKEAYFGAAGDEIYENDSLTTLADSRCRIRFVDEDIVTMAPETEFMVENFEDQRSEGKKSSFFRMVKGKAMFYAMRLFRYRDTRITLATPTATIGVRGTKFGAHVYYEDDKVAGGGVLVADSGNEIAPYLAQGAGGGRSFTDCFSEDGVLNVNGQAVSPGQMYSGRTGQVIPTPPSVIQSFRQETQIRGEGGSTSQAPGQTGGSEGGGAGPAASSGSLVGTPVLAADIQENVTQITNVQQGTKTEEQALPPKEPPPRKDIGYFAAMLTLSNGGPSMKDVFIQFEDHRRYELDSATGLGLANSANSLEVVLGGGDPHLKKLSVDGSSTQTPQTISKTKEGSNEYMEWGYWTMNSVSIGADSYYVNNRAYYLVGQATENLDRLKSLGNVAYSGNAWGTYYSTAGGSQMTGTFSTNVNLTSGAITNFGIDVQSSGGAMTATISGASGTIYGYANPGNNGCGHFDIDIGSGTWKLNGINAVNKAAQGALYGPNAEHIGGIWGMNQGGSVGAVGNFEGSRPQ